LNTLLITATEPQVGKTVLTAALAAYWQTYCLSQKLAILKPIQTGGGDRQLFTQLFALDQSLDEISPLHFDAPFAPPIAAAQDGRKIQLEQAWTSLTQLQQQRDLVLVEAWGGLGSPLTHETTVADLAWDWRLPTVLVVPVKFGAIGQAVANVALARHSRLHLKGIVLNCIAPCTPDELQNWAAPRLIQSLTQVSVLGCLPHLDDPLNIDALAAAAAQLDLDRLFPRLVSALSTSA
jgi:dethiobiotin synthetase